MNIFQKARGSRNKGPEDTSVTKAIRNVLVIGTPTSIRNQ